MVKLHKKADNRTAVCREAERERRRRRDGEQARESVGREEEVFRTSHEESKRLFMRGGRGPSPQVKNKRKKRISWEFLYASEVKQRPSSLWVSRERR